jgi:hypothetical protein
MTFFTFEFKGRSVGRFEESDYPRTPGRYRYEPFRGPGHYKMQTFLRGGGKPRCYYNEGINRVYFTVNDCPEYGVLDLRDFRTTWRLWKVALAFIGRHKGAIREKKK